MEDKRNNHSLPEGVTNVSKDEEINLDILEEEDNSFMTGKVQDPEPQKVQLNPDGILEEDLQEPISSEEIARGDVPSSGLPYPYYDVKGEHDGQEYLNQMMPQYKRSDKFKVKLILTLASVIISITAVALFAWFFLLNKSEEGPPAEPIDLIGNSTDLLSLMYDTKGVDTLTKNNNLILEHFIESLKKDFDLRDSLVYAKRYGIFYNSPTTLTIEDSYLSGRTVIVSYLITTDVSTPLQRIGFITYNESNLIESFLEYNTY